MHVNILAAGQYIAADGHLEAKLANNGQKNLVKLCRQQTYFKKIHIKLIAIMQTILFGSLENEYKTNHVIVHRSQHKTGGMKLFDLRCDRLHWCPAVAPALPAL